MGKKNEISRVMELGKQLKGKKLTKVEEQIVHLFLNDKDYQLHLDGKGNICATRIINKYLVGCEVIALGKYKAVVTAIDNELAGSYFVQDENGHGYWCNETELEKS